jgi:hypothetical protein
MSDPPPVVDYDAVLDTRAKFSPDCVEDQVCDKLLSIPQGLRMWESTPDTQVAVRPI